MDKIDLSNTTFVIPVKIEHEERIENLKRVVSYIDRNFATNIIINEQDSDIVRGALEGFSYIYMKQTRQDGHIHRTKQINDMVKKCDTEVIVNCDTDIICKRESYKKAQDMILNREADVVYPYDGNFYDVPKQFHDVVSDHNTINTIDIKKLYNFKPPHNPSLGGIVFFHKKTFVECGMENENFVSWGFEDDERYYRFNTLGATIKRVEDGGAYHLCHARTNNSNHHHGYYSRNHHELKRIKSFNKERLIKEIETWSWSKR